MRKINCVILDDEPMAVRLLADYVQKQDDLQLIFAGTQVSEVLEQLKEQEVDLIFLDIQMPEINGLQLMKQLGKQYHYIICSAYAEYALESYDFQVLDYMLKPISLERFRQSIDKYKSWNQPKTTDNYLLLRADRRDHRILLSDILYIEGLKDYVRIQLKDSHLLLLGTMKDLEQRLPGTAFIRIHRSYILPKEQIYQLDGQKLRTRAADVFPIGETYKERVHTWFRQMKPSDSR